MIKKNPIKIFILLFCGLVIGGYLYVGIIAVDNFDYDADRWWASSEGFKTVVEETIAYVYTLLVFPFVDDLSG